MNPTTAKAVQGLGVVLAVGTLVSACGQRPPDVGGTGPVVGTLASRDGVRVAYETRGEGGPALIFVHGWSCDRTYWNGQLEPFSRDFRVVSVDVGGHGESGLGREAWTISSFGEDVAAVADALSLERVILIGHSMGGDVIVEAARRMPDRVVGLVWIDTYSQLGTPRTPEQIEEMLAPFRSDFEERTRSVVRGMFPPTADPSLVDRVAADMSAAPPEVALQALGSAWAYAGEVTAALQELNLPVVAINPDDQSTDTQSLEAHGVEVVLMPDVGHFMMMEDPEGFNLLLSQVIDDLAR